MKKKAEKLKKRLENDELQKGLINKIDKTYYHLAAIEQIPVLVRKFSNST